MNEQLNCIESVENILVFVIIYSLSEVFINAADTHVKCLLYIEIPR